MLTFYLIAAVSASPLPLERAATAIDGLFTYFYRGEPHGNASFFFSCGQIGGAGPSGASVPNHECVCEEGPSGCVTCYRWWSAVALEASVSFAIAAAYSPLSGPGVQIMAAVQSAWVHAPYNAYWNATTQPTWVDDFAWYGLAWMRVFDWTGDQVWRQRALGILDWGFNYGWDRANTSTSPSGSRAFTSAGATCGGFWWSLREGQRFKDSISIVELLHLAARLARAAPAGSTERSHLLQRASSIWEWLQAFDHGSGLLAPNGIMSTGAVPEWCCNAASSSSTRLNGSVCANSQVPGESYNHGVLLSSVALLYELTADRAYLAHAASLLSAAVANLTNTYGVPKDEQRGARSQSTTCNASHGFDPGADFFSFKGIFVAHLGYATSSLVASGGLEPTMASQLHGIASASSDMAWARSAVFPPFDAVVDRCAAGSKAPPPASGASRVALEARGHSSLGHRPIGFASNSSDPPPKFRWWWTSGADAPVQTPPDVRLWLQRSGLACNYSQSLWSGAVPDAAACQAHCAADDRCHKYVYRLSASPTSHSFMDHAGATPECWLHGAAVGTARQEAGCTVLASGAVTGARRPPAPDLASCRATPCVGPQAAPLLEPSGGDGTTKEQCFCDATCARHLDCCSDYADVCFPETARMPSCLGRCVKAKVSEGSGSTSSRLSEGIPIPGGGYCFCDADCENDFTDNNSHGGCCADHAWRCNKEGERDPLCMDTRTQAQALNAFVAHHVVEHLAAPLARSDVGRLATL